MVAEPLLLPLSFIGSHASRAWSYLCWGRSRLRYFSQLGNWEPALHNRLRKSGCYAMLSTATPWTKRYPREWRPFVVWRQASRARHLVPGTWHQASRARHLVPGIACLASFSMHLVHGPSTSTEGNTPRGVPHVPWCCTSCVLGAEAYAYTLTRCTPVRDKGQGHHVGQ
jgi:hypothetical protein